MMGKSLILAIDFDGCIVKHKFTEPNKPYIGDEIDGAIVTLKKLKERGHKLIMWTGREGVAQKLAVDWCKERGLEFDAVNSNLVDCTGYGCSQKIYCHVFIDDRNIDVLGEGIKWVDIYKKILWLEEAYDVERSEKSN